jgi:uncharacterized protein
MTIIINTIHDDYHEYSFGAIPMRRVVLITGASTGIGAVYADRFARRGHDLVLVARNMDRMTTLAKRLRSETSVNVDVVPADLTEEQDLARVEQRLREDVRIGVLITNAGTAIPRHFIEQGGADISRLIALNVTALTRLANAAAPRFAQAEKVPSSISLPCSASPQRWATRTEIQEHAGVDIRTTRGVMEAGELVDAAFVGFDRREPITIPPLPDASQWSAFDTSRQAMLPNFAQAHAAERYRSVAR